VAAPAEAAAPALAPVELPTQPFLAPAAAAPSEAPLANSCPLSSGAPGVLPSRAAVSNAWQDGSASFVSARQEQATFRAPLLVYFYTDWCPYCRAFDQTVLKDSTFDRYPALRVRVNPERSDADRALANEFGVDRYPRVFLLASSFAEPRLMDLGTERLPDGSYRFKPAAEIVSDFDRQVMNAASALLRLGYDRRKQGDPRTAIRALTEALLIDPQRAEAWLHRGLAEQEAGEPERAYEDFRTALSLQRGYVDVYASVAYDLGKSERWDEAAACWTAYLEGGPRDPRALYERSRAHARRGDLVRAREDMGEACKLGDDAACSVASSLKG
jgi:tetratricopeptide (TPR) repeat protein